MPSLLEIAGPMDVARFALWVLAVVGLGKFLFRSFWSDTLHARIQARGGRFSRMDVLTWEIREQKHAPTRPGDPLSASAGLMPEEIGRKRYELEALKRGTFWQRGANYQRLCLFCHCLGAAIVLYLAFASHGRDWWATLAAYATAATLIASRMAPAAQGHTGGQGHGKGETCQSCGASKR